MTSNIYYHNALNRDLLVKIVDEDNATCEALGVLFRLEGFQTSASTSISEFLASIERKIPDVVIINMQVGGEDSLPTVTRFKNMRTGAPIFMLTESQNIGGAVDAMKVGAADVITKPIDTEHLVRSVRQALQRNVHIGAVQSGSHRPVEVRGFSQLTPREREVLQLITNGQSNKEAGRELGISPRTIEVHRARVMQKLGARNTADLVRIVLTS
ncbi:FixJ family two-component response regulator [Maritalea mobilis]|uniref:FixJ family two-component response regulator n=1 Tax=Maritalea mobilis TaxID=483324 RepID=A0A4R6VKC9_9HYPH|nr:LuxR C-terminal-related transcriptional regulator [Maritalea mobilis]TDQ64109.1 FixJ family two-component response regulator [Maritalea mobilis]